jgi:hypothetical protein
MNDYLCVTLMGNSGEGEAAFKARLAAFWTHMIRNRPDDYEKIYAEATRFGNDAGQVTRQYMVEVDVAEVLAAELISNGIAAAPIDLDDTYSKYEAVSPDWFQIEH